MAACIAYASHVVAAGPHWGPLDPGNGPWAIDYYDALWGVTPDPSIYFGYNQSAGGVPFLAGEPGLSIGIEGNYWINDGKNYMEFYLQYIDGVGGPPLRPLYFGFDRQNRMLGAALIGGAPTINFGNANDNIINA